MIDKIREGMLKNYTKLLGDAGVTKTIDLTPYITAELTFLDA
ncbi:hypothetical protein LCGC14_2310470, partial [marine sediment metagenome]